MPARKRKVVVVLHGEASLVGAIERALKAEKPNCATYDTLADFLADANLSEVDCLVRKIQLKARHNLP